MSDQAPTNGQDQLSAPAGFTPTEQRMLSVLADGLPHSRQELHACLWDEQSALSAIQVHISHIRKRLRPCGEDIVCEYYQRTFQYRHVRLLASSYDGKR